MLTAGVSAPVGIFLIVALLVLGCLGWAQVESNLVDTAGRGLTYTVGKWVILSGTLGTMVAGFLAMALHLALLDNAGEGSAWGLLYVFLAALLSALVNAVQRRVAEAKLALGRRLIDFSASRVAPHWLARKQRARSPWRTGWLRELLSPSWISAYGYLAGKEKTYCATSWSSRGPTAS